MERVEVEKVGRRINWRFILTLLVSIAVIGVGILWVYSVVNANRVAVETPREPAVLPVKEEEVRLDATPESQMIDVEPGYWQSVNANITLEMLENLKTQGIVQVMTFYGTPPGTPYAIVGVGLHGRVIDIDVVDRTLTLEADPPFQIYFGENVTIHLLVGPTRRVAKFSDIGVGDLVGITGRLQYGRGDPFRPNYLGIAK